MKIGHSLFNITMYELHLKQIVLRKKQTNQIETDLFYTINAYQNTLYTLMYDRLHMPLKDQFYSNKVKYK